MLWDGYDRKGSLGLAFSLSCPSVPFLLRAPDAGLGRHAGFLLCVGPGLEVRVRKDVLAGVRVIPSQLSVSPSEEVQHSAVALQDSFFDFLDGNWFILAVCQPLGASYGSAGSG